MENAAAGIRKVIIGQDDAIRYSLVVVLCNQHALIEGVPGLGKTLLARTLAAVMGCAEGTVKSRLSRALGRLRDRMAPPAETT